jgi:putative spermidine/putrescine transport system permease protein
VNAASIEAAPTTRNRLAIDWAALLMCTPALVLVSVALLAPLLLMFVLSVHDQNGDLTAENYLRLLEPLYVRSAWITIKLAFTVTLGCALLGYPLCYFLSRLSARSAGVALLLVLLPFWTSVLVRTYAWLILLQRRGVVNDALQSAGLIDEPLRLVHNFFGTTVGMIHVLLPFLALPLYTNMRSIPGEYVRAASSLGSSPAHAFWRVFFPLSLPGLTAGMTLVFILSLGFFVTPALLGGGKVSTWPVHVEKALAIYPDAGAASALGIGLLTVTLTLLGLLRLASRRFTAARAR